MIKNEYVFNNDSEYEATYTTWMMSIQWVASGY